MKIETKVQLEHRLKNQVKVRIKDHINERMEVHIKNLQNKNRTKNRKLKVNYTQPTNKDIITFRTIYLTIIPKSTIIHNTSLAVK